MLPDIESIFAPQFRFGVKDTAMQQAITGYHLDEEQHWVAELACGHNQHVRHQPPFINRPWVITEKGRSEKLGMLLKCKKCDLGAPKDRLVD
ncbi:DUF3565 domain-containing protein [Thalassotalea ganghwensis]